MILEAIEMLEVMQRPSGVPSRGRAIRVARRAAMVATLPALLSCGGDGTGPEVSDTEIWQLWIEQTDDGGDGQPLFGRRGSIIMMMRLNHSTQPDPGCAGTDVPDVTTFVATVEALGSRLQSPVAGGANGSWNCHGFSADVRLDDGTMHTLTSEDFKEPNVDPAFPKTSWSSGVRRGHFVFRLSLNDEPFDSHMDVQVQNNRDDVTQTALIDIDGSRSWRLDDLGNIMSDSVPRYAAVPATTIGSYSWPSFEGVGRNPPGGGLHYRIWALDGVGPAESTTDHSAEVICLLPSNHPDVVDVIVQEDGRLECGNGWEDEGTHQGVPLEVSPQRLFLQPGDTEFVRVSFHTADPVRVSGVTSSHPSIGVEDRAFHGEGGIRYDDLHVTAAANAPRSHQSVTVTVVDDATDDSSIVVIPVDVYELNVVAQDTVTIAAGQRDTVAIQLMREGLDGFELELLVWQPPPPGLFQVEPDFSPIASGASALDLWVSSNAEGRAYDLGICAVIVSDPTRLCHLAPLTLVVTEASTLHYDLRIFTTPSNDVAVLGQSVFFDIHVSSLGGDVPGPIIAEALLPPGFTYTAHEASRGSYSPLTGHWSIDTVRADALATLRIHATADSIGTFTNTATLIGGIGGDTDPANNTSSGQITITPAAGTGYDLEVVKQVDRDTVAMGDTVTFTLTATNHGPGNPLSVWVSDHLPAGLEYVSDDGGGGYNPVTGDWYIGYPLPGESRTLHIRAVAFETSINRARVMSESNEDTNSANDASTATVIVP